MNRTSSPSFVASPDAEILYVNLVAEATKDPGAVITYEWLSTTISRDVSKEARHLLNTARRRALSKNRMVFEVVRGVGVKLVSDTEMVKLAAASRKKAGKAAKRGLKKIETVELTKLDQDQRTRLVAEATVLSMQAEAAKERSVKKLVSRASSKDMVPLLEASLDMFR